MATTIFPQNGDTGGEEQFRAQGIHGTMNRSFIYAEQGFGFGEVTGTTGLDVDIRSGNFSVGGAVFQISATVTLTLPDNTTCVVVYEPTESSGLIQTPANDADPFNIYTSLASIPDYTDRLALPLFVAVTASGSVTDTYDIRWRSGVSTSTYRTVNPQGNTDNATDTLEPAFEVPHVETFQETTLHHIKMFVTQASSGFQFDLNFIGLGSIGGARMEEVLLADGTYENVATNLTKTATTTVPSASANTQVVEITPTPSASLSEFFGVMQVRFANDTGGTSNVRVPQSSFCRTSFDPVGYRNTSI